MITAINFFLYFFGSSIELVAITFMLTPKKSKLSAFIIMFMSFFFGATYKFFYVNDDSGMQSVIIFFYNKPTFSSNCNYITYFAGCTYNSNEAGFFQLQNM